MSITTEQLQFDKKHLWHPYTNLKHPSPVFGVESAEGVFLTLSNGQTVVDGMSSWWSAIHGYNHPQLNQALESQIQKMSHVMFGGLTHQPAIELAKKLVDITAEKLDCVFLADSGSVAVEVALKMALQYCRAIGEPHKNKFLTISKGYHGDTFGAMAVCDPLNGMHAMFHEVIAENLFVDSPDCEQDSDWTEDKLTEFKVTLEAKKDKIAAVILEPIVQGAGGMHVYCPEFLRQVDSLCQQHNILLILDEIATGFGRTGTLFAYEQAEISPDILCIGKALTGGYLSLAATLSSRKIADAIGSFGDGNLMHGPTFMGNPLACAAANKSIDLLIESNWKQRIKNIEQQLSTELMPCISLSSVADVRVKGAIAVIELKYPVDMHKIQPRLVELGVWIRPFGKLLYIMPAYIIEPEQLSCLTTAMKTVAEELSLQ